MAPSGVVETVLCELPGRVDVEVDIASKTDQDSVLADVEPEITVDAGN